MSFITHTSQQYAFERSGSSTLTRAALMERPVNNYLKSSVQIEAECILASSDKKLTLDKVLEQLKKDGYCDIHNLDEILSGNMEENY